MKKILITGSTDGIGLATANTLLEQGHTVLLHGRSESKLETLRGKLAAIHGAERVPAYRADLSNLDEVVDLANKVTADHPTLEVLINNAGVYVVPDKLSKEGLDVRFVVNTIAPFLLTLKLIATLGSTGRVINLSSAAQSPIDPESLTQANNFSDDAVYAQSKLALTMWSRQLALSLGDDGPAVIAVNPASFLGSNMVKQAYGVVGNDLQVGADILARAAISTEFKDASGLYFDNDKGQFSKPHPDALNAQKIAALTAKLEEITARYINSKQR